MIDIQIHPRQFEYDVQSMVQAFYTGLPFQINSDIERAYRVLEVEFAGESIGVSLYDGNKKLFNEQISCEFLKNKDITEISGSVRRDAKNALKKLLYCILEKDTGRHLPWGNLTGIRPAKIPGMLMEEGMSEQDARKEMKETYFISNEKLDLAMDVSKMEKKVLSNVNYKEGYSLYVGIPFCPTTCLYCSFTSYPLKIYKDKVDDYIDAVIKEIIFLGGKLEGRELNSVYIGGGTPTTLEPKQLERLITALKENFDFQTVKEFTVEAGRPDSITKEKLLVLKEQGVSRISINPQTMNQETLDLIGRKHTIEQVKDAFKMARECGMNNINMDFIVGLPEETPEMVRYSMEEAMKLEPDGITIHSLAIKRASRLSMNKKKYAELSMENSTELMNITKEYAYKMGMKPYYLYRQKNMAGNQENVGYSKEGLEGLYNILMMGDYQDVWAVGAGAVTKLLSGDRKNATRIDTLKNVDQYIERIDEMIDRKSCFLL
ncbi:MAG: coproporphyrinogen dehydrogenase HemZ [Eubacterium sp.]|nr:coproporphyrinogen dehydrogenase HemZ [Eubacterium sp.]